MPTSTPAPAGSSDGASAPDTVATERPELAAVLRRLIAAAVTSTAAPEELDAITARLEPVAEVLEGTVPGPGAGRLRVLGDRSARADEAVDLASRMPFDVVIGASNPLAPPVVLEVDPPNAIGHVTFSAQYEGAPGYVHGGVLASVFDIVLSAANVLADAGGPTVSLTVRYLKPTTIGRPCRFEAWVTEVDRRRTNSWGTLTQDGVVTAEAEGVFAQITGFGAPRNP